MFWLADRIRLLVYNIILLSLLCKLIWRHWTSKMPVRYSLSSVWVRLSVFLHLSIILQYMGLCVFSLLISLVMIERIYTLSYYHHQIGNMNYSPLFRVRSWNNGVRCMSLYILNNNIYSLFTIIILIIVIITNRIIILVMIIVIILNSDFKQDLKKSW